jgi:single-stranded DNA-specific DHH superfamily exonuclease
MDEIKKELISSERPLFFFHDDADGLASYLQFYKQVNRGKWIIVKSTPQVTEKFLRTVNEYNPDKIFVLDLAMIDQEFVDKANKKIIWLDHHELSQTKGTKYFNPKQNNPKAVTCIAKLSYDIFQDNSWIAAVGTIGDWQLPSDLKEKIEKDYPGLLGTDTKTAPQALFETKVGTLAKIFNFILKGETKHIHKAVTCLTRVNDPYEILNQTTEEGKLIYKKYMEVNKEYESLLKDAEKKASEDKLLVFTYEENKISLSGELSNELLYRFPDKVIVIARHHMGEMKTSFRSGKNIKVRDVLDKAMVGVSGRFGGHEHACGGLIKDYDWERLLDNMRNVLN